MSTTLTATCPKCGRSLVGQCPRCGELAPVKTREAPNQEGMPPLLIAARGLFTAALGFGLVALPCALIGAMAWPATYELVGQCFGVVTISTVVLLLFRIAQNTGKTS